jgi:hypothetical protein
VTAPALAVPTHPAKYTQSVMERLEQLIINETARQERILNVLDPFAGTGRIHEFQKNWAVTYGVELEPEWASIDPRTVCGDACHLPFPDSSMDMIVTSPCYGNRMADTYDGRDGSRRMTYRIALGRELSDNSAAGLQWGPLYRQLHETAINEMMRVAHIDSLIVVNMSNHIRSGEIQLVVEWWVERFINRGVTLIEVSPVETPRYQHGANYEARVESEHLIVCRVVRPFTPKLF